MMALDWRQIEDDLNQYGCAVVPRLLNPAQCAALAAQYGEASRFRSRVVMQRHGFGQGEYQYWAYPLPDVVAALREQLYGPLAAIANRWYASMGVDSRFPSSHADFLARCHAAGQTRPTPLLLRYRKDDYNCLHQDLYGQHAFQAALRTDGPLIGRIAGQRGAEDEYLAIGEQQWRRLDGRGMRGRQGARCFRNERGSALVRVGCWQQEDRQQA